MLALVRQPSATCVRHPLLSGRSAVSALGNDLQDEFADGPSGLALLDKDKQVLEAKVSQHLQVNV